MNRQYRQSVSYMEGEGGTTARAVIVDRKNSTRFVSFPLFLYHLVFVHAAGCYSLEPLYRLPEHPEFDNPSQHMEVRG